MNAMIPSQTTDNIIDQLFEQGRIDEAQAAIEAIQHRYDLLVPMFTEPEDPDRIWEDACFGYLTELPLTLRKSMMLPLIQEELQEQGMDKEESAILAQLHFQAQYGEG